MVSTKARPRAIRRADPRRVRRKIQPNYISKAQGEALLDRQARKYLKMSGAEFREKYQSGKLRGSDHPEVVRVAFLLPMTEE